MLKTKKQIKAHRASRFESVRCADIRWNRIDRRLLFETDFFRGHRPGSPERPVLNDELEIICGHCLLKDLFIQGCELAEVEVRTYDSPVWEELDLLQLNDWGSLPLLPLGSIAIECLRILKSPNGKGIKQAIRDMTPGVIGWDHRKYVAYILGVAEKQSYTAIDCYCLWMQIRDRFTMDDADSFEASLNIKSCHRIEGWIRKNEYGIDKKAGINSDEMKRLEALYRIHPVSFEYRQRLSRDQFDHAMRYIRASDRLFGRGLICTGKMGIDDFKDRLKTIREIVRCCGDLHLMDLIDAALNSSQQGFVEFVTIYTDWKIVTNQYLFYWKKTKKTA